MYNNLENDEELIKRVQAGDCDAFNPLIGRYKLPLYKMMYRMVYNRDDAEDLVEEAFIKAYRAIDRFSTEKKFFPWICRIAINNALNFLKKRKGQKADSLSQYENRLMDRKTDPVRMTESKLLKEKINQAIAQLPDEYRIIINLRVEQECSYDEISQILEIPKGTVMSRLARARKRLKEILKALGGIDEM